MLPVFFFFYRLRFVMSGLFIILAALLLIAAAAPKPIAVHGGHEAATEAAAMGVSNSPNAVTNAMQTGAYRLQQGLSIGLLATGHGIQTAALTTAHACGVVVHGTASAVGAVLRGVGSGIGATIRGLGSGIMFVVRVPANTWQFVSHTAVVNALIKPVDHNPVPIIDPHSPALLAAMQALPAQAPTPAAPLAVWPIHGQITTLFGVPEMPYQAVHTGLDISDGKTPGTTPIAAFRSGTVIDVERTGGLGNHVVIDHGSCVTSVYGHLNSISVAVGQHVDITTIVGYEGTTGVSTGPHLHFEVRVNGQATDPHQFISGEPYN